jgi:hypothetical protein
MFDRFWVPEIMFVVIKKDSLSGNLMPCFLSMAKFQWLHAFFGAAPLNASTAFMKLTVPQGFEYVCGLKCPQPTLLDLHLNSPLGKNRRAEET